MLTPVFDLCCVWRMTGSDSQLYHFVQMRIIVDSRVAGAALGFVILLAALTFPLKAQSSSLNEHRCMDAAKRIEIATDLQQSFKGLQDQLPTLSPREEEWLRKEVDGTIATSGGRYTERAMSAMESREYGLRVVGRNTLSLLVVLKQLTIPDPQPARITLREIGLWANVVSHLIDVGFWQEVEKLIRLRVIRPNVNGYDKLFLSNHASRSQHILDSIIAACSTGYE